jgi:heme O synthase-like polyprenyltransferase
MASKVYRVTLGAVVGLSAFATGYGIASGDTRVMFIGMTMALCAWIIEDAF